MSTTRNPYKKTFKDRIKKIGRCIRSSILCIRFPFLYIKEWSYRSEKPEFGWKIWKYIPEFTWLDDMPEGWRKNFGIQMCRDIRKELIKNHYLFKYTVVQVKEKFGGLRWYDDGAPGRVHDIVEDYASKSYYICINCGKPATKYTTGWICPYCDDCIPEGRPFREIKPKTEPVVEAEA